MLAVVGNNSEPLRLAFTSNNLQISRVLGDFSPHSSPGPEPVQNTRQMKGNK